MSINESQTKFPFTVPDQKGPNDLEIQIEVLEGKVMFLKGVCKRAGKEIKELKNTVGKLEKIASQTTDEILEKLRLGDKRPNLDYTEEK